MRKVGFSLIILLFLLSQISCENKNFNDKTFVFNAYYDDLANPGFKFSFKKDIFSINIPELDDRKIEQGEYINNTLIEPYHILKEGRFTFIQTSSDKYLVLFQGEICILVSVKTRNSFWGLEEGSKYIRIGTRIRQNHIGFRGGMSDYQKTSSYLTETINNKAFNYNGLSKYYFDLLIPWVEGVEGDGVGEWIIKRIAYQTDKIVFINGFIDPSRTDLYEKNSRVKKVTVKNDRNTWEFELEDTPNPQIISLPAKITGDIQFIISEVYSGSKYPDTSIAGIYFLE